MIIKKYVMLLGMVCMTFAPIQTVKAEEHVPMEKEEFFTTEDIIADIVFPTIDKKVIREYKGDGLLEWKWKGITSINYNENHSYDVSARIQVNADVKQSGKIAYDWIRMRIAPSCDSEKLNKQLCNHNFEIKILEYKHLSD